MDDYGLTPEQHSQFMEAVTPKLEEIGLLVREFIANTHPGRDRKTLTRLSAQLERVVQTMDALGWDTRVELSRAIGGGAAIPGRVGTRSDEDLAHLLRTLQVRAHELAAEPQEYLRGRSATNEAKDLFAPQFVDAICRAWPGEVVTTTDPRSPTFVSVVEHLFEQHTGLKIEAKRFVSAWLKQVEM